MKKKLLLNKHKGKQTAEDDADREPAKKRKAKKARVMRLKRRKNSAAEELAKHLVIDENGLIADGDEAEMEDFEPAFEDEEEDETLSFLEKAKRCMCRFPPEVDRAKSLLEEALKSEPKNLEVLEYFGTLLSEEGDEERAREVLLRSVELKPEGCPERYLYLAQLSRGSEALDYYRKGASALKAQLESSSSSSSSSSAAAPGLGEKAGSKILRAQLAGVQASIAELYMTDLADDDDAEERCEEAVLEGLKADEACLALLTAQTSLLKVQGRVEEAKQVSLKCFKLISAAIDAAAEEGDLQDDDEEEETDGSVRPTLPDEDTIAALARDLIDLEQTNEARELMCGLLARDEEDFRAWILLGWCHVVEADPDTAKDCASHGLKLCKKHGDEADMWKPELKKLLDKANSMKPGAKKAEGTTTKDEGEEKEKEKEEKKEDA